MLSVGQQVAVPAEYELSLSAEVTQAREGYSKMFIDTHACWHTHTVCTYIIIIRGGALLSVRIADCYCNRDDLKRDIVTWTWFSSDILQSLLKYCTTAT